ncbi:hypothetical protein BKA70DRAFT_1427055 [Coprinopsis sp. MPI-PUGE-AT-0042]|nr:hypothetical protein BKA70DRAFT_1427055 [Coprinopsis sp. MPI-PUGE-AT-0042]
MMMAECAILETAFGGRNRQHFRVEEEDEEEEEEEEEGDGVEAGCLGRIGPGIKRLFHCGSRKPMQRTERRTYMERNPQRGDDENRGEGTIVDRTVAVVDSVRSAYPPHQGARAERGIVRPPVASNISPRVDEGRPSPTSFEQDVFSGGLPVADNGVAPPIFQAVENAHISGGNFYAANNIVQNIYPTTLPNIPGFMPPDSWPDSEQPRTVRYEVTWREIR